MSSSNIDAASVKALLDRLRGSQAWQDAVNSQASTSGVVQTVPSPQDKHTPDPGNTAPSVASLLSQLNATPSTNTHSEPQLARSRPYGPSSIPVPTLSARGQTLAPVSNAVPPVIEDVRGMSFQQALPRLGELAEDPAVVAAIQRLKQEQDRLERLLWDERTAIRTKFEEKVQVAKNKATMIGVGLSKHEADMLVSGYEKELARFDSERVVPAWDGLVSNQQSALAQLGIPAMFPTTVRTDAERQQRVIQVLEGILG